MKRRPLRSSGVRYTILKACVVIMALLSPCIARTDSESGPSQRLAILSSKEVQQSGLSDLLTVQLQERPGVELVERDLLHKVLGEVVLSSMLGAEQSENRRNAAALLRADMLVLLSLGRVENEAIVKVVISDCSSGARLRIGQVPFDRGKLEDMCEELTKIVRETLDRFKDGVKQIIGVSYFVSKNLIHDYDHLQAGYANLLGSVLSALPGVAVIEIEEARALRLEDALAGDMQVHQVVPVFVEGEFMVRRTGADEQPKVYMTVCISDSNGVVKRIDSNGMTMDKAAGFITDDIGREILSLSESPSLQMLDKEKVFEALVNRASEFGKVGLWKYSTCLREAAVLLYPNSVDQRMQLIREYLWIKRPRYSFEHLEYMIYNQMIPIGNAVTLSKKCLDSLRQQSDFYYVPLWVSSLKEDFLRTAYLRIPKLELSDPNSGPREYQRWYHLLVTQSLSGRASSGCGSKADLDFWLHVHKDLLPEEVRPTREFIRFLRSHVRPEWRKRPSGFHSKSMYFERHPEHFSEQDFLDFITAMSSSKKPLASCYGWYALLCHEYYQRQQQGESMYDLYYDAVLLSNEIEEHKFRHLARETKGLLKKIEQYFVKNGPQEVLDPNDEAEDEKSLDTRKNIE